MGVLSFKEATHLVARTGLGVEWDVVKRLEGQARHKAVEHVINPSPSPLKPPPGMTPWFKLEPMRQTDIVKRNSAWSISQREGHVLQSWWVEQMLTTQAPFVERMTLFWHNHFTSSIQKTLQPSLLFRQNVLFRRHAVGNFAELLHAIARDPAMLVYLDGYQNVKGQPNENFARELLELFTVGRGEYRETDIKAAAKAFTGWGIDNRTGKFIIRPDQHDSSPSSFMGRKGSFTGDEIIKILLDHPRTAERITEKFWRAFINTRPDYQLIKTWGAKFKQSGYNVKVLLRTLLNSEAFWLRYNRGTLVKSPVELVVGTLRTLPYPRESTEEILHTCRLLGQEVFDPPNVKGWAGGEHWINTQTLPVRNAFLAHLSRNSLDGHTKARTKFPNVSEQQIVEWLLPVAPLQPLPQGVDKPRLVRALLLDPAFQVV